VGVALRIEDYALIGDTRTAALVGRDGSIDWLCLPRFDSGACFAALLGDDRHGRWKIAPSGEVAHAERRYRPGTLVLETDFETADGAVRITDCMPLSETATEVARVVEGLRGSVAMTMQLEGAFLPCSFWLVDALALIGRRDEAVELFERMLGLCNDVGLLSEEYDPRAGRLVGNFPQAFSHIGLVNSAMLLSREERAPTEERAAE
jgi:GH15 family glucan-1,4-alpha-glucosidase